MNQPFFSPSAHQDLLAIAGDKPGAALRHVQRLEDACWMLAKNPALGTAREELLPDLRCWSIGNYVVFYRPTDGGIDVVRVVHGARDVDKLFE